jgi:hypothetical protein
MMVTPAIVVQEEEENFSSACPWRPGAPAAAASAGYFLREENRDGIGSGLAGLGFPLPPRRRSRKEPSARFAEARGWRKPCGPNACPAHRRPADRRAGAFDPAGATSRSPCGPGFARRVARPLGDRSQTTLGFARRPRAARGALEIWSAGWAAAPPILRKPPLDLDGCVLDRWAGTQPRRAQAPGDDRADGAPSSPPRFHACRPARKVVL